MMENKKQNSIDWLQGMIYYICEMNSPNLEIKINFKRIEELFKQAKEMQEKEIENARDKGYIDGYDKATIYSRL